jgi:hypothetical protein
MKKFGCIGMLIWALVIVGEVKCAIKAINCNWEPIGKAEAIYTVAFCTGFGTFVGWMDIEDK